MNSDLMSKTGATIERILGLLDEELMRSEIDERIEKAAAQFEFDHEVPVTHQFFTRIISAFVQHIYEHGLRLPRLLSASQALTEAVAVLERGYRNPHAMGYDAAYLDAVNPEQNGVVVVLAGMTEAIKETERKKYVRWVFRSCIDQSDWNMKCQMAEFLLEHIGPFLPPEILRYDPAQLAEDLPELIVTHLRTDRVLGQLLSGSANLKQPLQKHRY